MLWLFFYYQLAFSGHHLHPQWFRWSSVINKKTGQGSLVLKNIKHDSRIEHMVKHPNIAQLYESLETENSHDAVMGLCLGNGLLNRTWNQKKRSERDVKMLSRWIVSSVGHLHRHRIVLRLDAIPSSKGGEATEGPRFINPWHVRRWQWAQQDVRAPVQLKETSGSLWYLSPAHHGEKMSASPHTHGNRDEAAATIPSSPF